METKYIKLENALKAVNDRIEELEKKHGPLRPSTEIGIWGVKYYLLDIPAEEVTPVVHGHWITYTYEERNGCDCWGRPEYDTIIEHECSYCHSKIITSKIKVYNYCPFCGAKMEESGELNEDNN